MSHCQITYHSGSPSTFLKLTETDKFSLRVSKPGTPTGLKPTLQIICQRYMTQICCVCVCVCLLKLSLLYPAPHMDTAMQRISPSFLTKPSEQPAKNNITCCLRSGPAPLEKTLPEGGGGEREELIRFKTSPTLASTTAATNSKHRPDSSAASWSCTRGQRGVEGESLYFWTSSLYIFSAQGWTEGISSYFLTQNMSRLKAREDSSFNRPVSLSWDEPRIASIAFTPPVVNEPK